MAQARPIPVQKRTKQKKGQKVKRTLLTRQTVELLDKAALEFVGTVLIPTALRID